MANDASASKPEEAVVPESQTTKGKKSRAASDPDAVRWRKDAKDGQGKSSWKSYTYSSSGQSSDDTAGRLLLISFA